MLRRKLPVSSVVFGVLALACGVAAFALMQAWTQRVNTMRPNGGAPVSVAVVTRDLPRGVTLTAEMMRDATVPEAFAPPAAVGSTHDALGRVLAADIAGGEVLTGTRLAGASSGPIAALVPPGLRAVVVPTALPSDPLRPGDLVDVLAAFGGPQSHVETVGQGLEVARVLSPEDAAARTPGATGTVGPSLILLADPATSEDLAFALAFATITVTVDAPPQSAAPASSVPTSPPVIATALDPSADP
jgi:Flp pilus assembly protein CpaB